MATNDKIIDNVPDNNKQVSDVYGYSKLSVGELRKVITDLVKSNEVVKDDKKDYNAAANEVIKETNLKISTALSFLSSAEFTGTEAAHENNVADFLAHKNAKA